MKLCFQFRFIYLLQLYIPYTVYYTVQVFTARIRNSEFFDAMFATMSYQLCQPFGLQRAILKFESLRITMYIHITLCG